MRSTQNQESADVTTVRHGTRPGPAGAHAPVGAGAPPGRTASDLFDVSWIRSALIVTICLKIAALVLAFDPLGLQAFDLPKALLSRAMEWILAGLCLLALLRFGTAVLPLTRLHLAVLAYVLAVAISGMTSESAYVSLYGEQGSYLGLTFAVDMAVLYFAVAIAFRHTADWISLAGCIIALALVTSLYGVVQYAGLDPIPWVQSSSIRPFSTLGNPNQFAHFLTIATGIAVGIALFARTTRLRVVAAGCCGLFVVAAGLTGARGGLLGLAVALMVALVLAWRGRGGRAPLAAILPGLLAVLVLAALVLASPAGQRLEEGPLADRVLQYEVALKAFADRPLLGYGPDQYQIGFIENRPPEAVPVLGVERPLWAHDFVLQAMVTTGLIGTAAMLVVIAMGTALLFATLGRAPAIAGPLLIAWIAYWMEALVTVSSASVDWLPWVVLGVCASVDGTRVRAIRRRTLAPVLRGVLVATACVGAVTGFTALRANHDAGSARLAMRANDPDRALAAASSAVHLDPGRADYWNWLGIANEALGRSDKAAAAYDAAVARSGYVATYWANVARARALGPAGADQTALALDAARHAIELDAYDPLIRRSVADTALILGDCDRALSEMLLAYKLTKGDLSYVADVDRPPLCVRDAPTAKQALTDALQVSEKAPLYASRAMLELRSNDLAAAQADAMRALELDRFNASARSVLEALGVEN
jgi:putative inorganic carbon (HCO3(-)) transporter